MAAAAVGFIHLRPASPSDTHSLNGVAHPTAGQDYIVTGQEAQSTKTGKNCWPKPLHEMKLSAKTFSHRSGSEKSSSRHPVWFNQSNPHGAITLSH